MKNIEITASISCADLLHAGEVIEQIQKTDIACIHYDVVDGYYNDCFVLGDELLKQIKQRYEVYVEVHLAVKDIATYLGPFIRAGADAVAVHYEAMENPLITLHHIRKQGVSPILAFRAETPVPSELNTLLPYVDGILKLTVDPGYAGQPLQQQALHHIRTMRLLIESVGSPVRIQADGNVNIDTIKAITAAGAHTVTGGSSGLFRSSDLTENIRLLHENAEVFEQ